MKAKIMASNAIKNITIAVLLVAAVFLAVRAYTYSSETPWDLVTGLFSGGDDSAKGSTGAGSDNLEVPVPAYIMITSPSGEHYAVKYGYQLKSDLFSQYSALLGEALGSADSPQKLTEDQWQATLKYSNVFVDYLYPRPLSYLASCLGVKVSDKLADMDASRLCIGCDGDDLIFTFVNSGSGSIYSYSTALDSDILYSQIVQQSMDNSHFAFEMGEEYSYLDSYFIFSDEEISLRSAVISAPAAGDLNIQALLSAFNMSDRASQEYSEGDGSMVYVDGSKSLRVENGGTVVFSAAGADGALSEDLMDTAGKSKYIEQAQSLVSSVILPYSGVGRLTYSGCDLSSSPSTTLVTFNYTLDGVPVTLGAGGSAVTVKYSGGDIIRVEMKLRTYTYTGTQESPLPENQAAALASVTGGFPVLFYEDKESSGSYNWLLF